MRINHNLAALAAVDTLNGTNAAIQKSMEALSSGLRVNSSSDDASGLAISEKMRSQIAGYDVAIKNAQDGISMLRTAESALSEADSLLQRMRELAVQSANDTLTHQDRSYIQDEIDELKSQLNIISQTTQFNKKNLLDGSVGALWSSNNPEVRAIVNGGLTGLDANYRIEIKTEAGKAQVQKTSVLQGVYYGEYLTDTITNDDGTQEQITIVTENEAALRDIANFYNSDGEYILNEPQKLNIIQGNGQMASVMLYGNDTLEYAVSKINDAIAYSLGQSRYTDDPSRFAVISDGTQGTHESLSTREEIDSGYRVNASVVIRSAVAGRDGELFFTGDIDLIKALGLNTIQDSSENSYKVSIIDAHTDKELAHEIKITGSRLHGFMGKDFDVELGTMAGVKALWNESGRQYDLSGKQGLTADLHIADNSASFQTGTNQDERFIIQFGDMSSKALDINRVNVMTRETAARSIGIIDNAMDRIVKERTKIISCESSLENTLASLAVSSLNLTSSQTRITDADMAKSALRFMEFKILSKSQAAVLVQANQQPESIIALMDMDYTR